MLTKVYQKKMLKISNDVQKISEDILNISQDQSQDAFCQNHHCPCNFPLKMEELQEAFSIGIYMNFLSMVLVYIFLKTVSVEAVIKGFHFCF